MFNSMIVLKGFKGHTTPTWEDRGEGGRGVCLTSDLRVNIDKVWGRYHIVVVLFKNAFITGYWQVLDIEPVVVAIVYHYKLDRLLKRCSHRYS